ncbi:hypothetical protein NQ318_009732 [Aromia moschata]|uniref:Uncharacterized protein n=1 Tax=Aromia moschata TaxID=1265417 RepID=A0AAV8Y1L1_9CUCU|nr:hypothetical protein NQ318_009732 [Aromia moschata]
MSECDNSDANLLQEEHQKCQPEIFVCKTRIRPPAHNAVECAASAAVHGCGMWIVDRTPVEREDVAFLARSVYFAARTVALAVNCLLSVLKMAGKFLFSEQVDMLLVLGFCERNCRRNCTRERAIAIRAQDEELILNTIEDEPHISTRNLSRQTGISQTSVHRVIRRNLLHPYHIQKVQELLPDDLYPNKWMRRGNNCPKVWPPRSPDLNKCDLFLWGTLKEFLYSSPVAPRAELWNRITDKCNIIRNNQRLLESVDFNFRRRINLCLRENVGVIWKTQQCIKQSIPFSLSWRIYGYGIQIRSINGSNFRKKPWEID